MGILLLILLIVAILFGGNYFIVFVSFYFENGGVITDLQNQFPALLQWILFFKRKKKHPSAFTFVSQSIMIYINLNKE